LAQTSSAPTLFGAQQQQQQQPQQQQQQSLFSKPATSPFGTNATNARVQRLPNPDQAIADAIQAIACIDVVLATDLVRAVFSPQLPSPPSFLP
jgi:hypothetical protein